MHPLNSDLSQLSDTDLHKKYSELNNRLTQAYRIGPASVIGQLQMLIEDYKFEISTRNQKILNDMEKKGKDFNKIIDIQ